MATVRKRTWTHKGEIRSAWVVDYTDQGGKRRLKTFGTKRAADAWMVDAAHEVKQGIHTPDSDSITVSVACELWIARAETECLQRSTVRQYRQQANLHIGPALGAGKVARLTGAGWEEFKDDLLRRLSRPMARKVMSSLRSVLAEAMRRGMIAQNVAREVKMGKRGRHTHKLEIGADIPTKEEIRVM